MTIRACGGGPLSADARFEMVRWVDDGSEVIAPVVINGKRTGLRCIVACAAGRHARVENAARGFAHWYADRGSAPRGGRWLNLRSAPSKSPRSEPPGSVVPGPCK